MGGEATAGGGRCCIVADTHASPARGVLVVVPAKKANTKCAAALHFEAARQQLELDRCAAEADYAGSAAVRIDLDDLGGEVSVATTCCRRLLSHHTTKGCVPPYPTTRSITGTNTTHDVLGGEVALIDWGAQGDTSDRGSVAAPNASLAVHWMNHEEVSLMLCEEVRRLSCRRLWLQ